MLCTNPLAQDTETVNKLETNAGTIFQHFRGFPGKALIEQNLFKTTKEKLRILFVDDCFDELCREWKHVAQDIATTLCHHENLLVLVSVQSLCCAQSSGRQTMLTMLRNASLIVLFCDQRAMAVISILARQFFGKRSEKLVAPYERILSCDEKYKYICLDFTQPTKNIVREGGLAGDDAFLYKD